jgi:hypothetical protein
MRPASSTVQALGKSFLIWPCDRGQKESPKRAAANREGHLRSSRASLGKQTKECLLKEARAKDIRGRSTMSKDELIQALKKAG